MIKNKDFYKSYKKEYNSKYNNRYNYSNKKVIDYTFHSDINDLVDDFLNHFSSYIDKLVENTIFCIDELFKIFKDINFEDSSVSFELGDFSSFLNGGDLSD